MGDEKKDNPQLTKAELALLDFLIADAQERGETTIPAGLGKDIVRDMLRVVTKEVLHRVLNKVMGGTLPQGKNITREDVEKALNQAGDEPSLDEIIEIRKHLEDIVK